VASHQWFNDDGETEFAQVYDSRTKGAFQTSKDPSELAVILNILCEGDVRIEIWTQSELGRNEVIFAFWFNTAFVVCYELQLKQHELDIANKDIDHINFPEDFYVSLIFSPVNHRAICYD